MTRERERLEEQYDRLMRMEGPADCRSDYRDELIMLNDALRSALADIEQLKRLRSGREIIQHDDA